MFSALPTISALPSLANASLWVLDWIPSGLFGQTIEISSSVNRWFRRSSSASANGLWFFVLVAILLLWAGLYFWDRYRKPGKRIKPNREGLFLQLCDLHNLSRADQQFLRKVANSQSLDQPGLAFVDPRVLMRFIEDFPQSATNARQLLDRLFGESLVEEIVQASSVKAAASSV